VGVRGEMGEPFALAEEGKHPPMMPDEIPEPYGSLEKPPLNRVEVAEREGAAGHNHGLAGREGEGEELLAKGHFFFAFIIHLLAFLAALQGINSRPGDTSDARKAWPLSPIRRKERAILAGVSVREREKDSRCFMARHHQTPRRPHPPPPSS